MTTADIYDEEKGLNEFVEHLKAGTATKEEFDAYGEELKKLLLEFKQELEIASRQADE